MEHIDALQDKIYQECVELLQNLLQIQSRDDLISKKHFVLDLYQHVSFLDLLEKNAESFEPSTSELAGYEEIEAGSEPFLSDDVHPMLVDTNQVATTMPALNLECNGADPTASASGEGLRTDNISNIESFTSAYSDPVDVSASSGEGTEFFDELIEEDLIAESVINEDLYERAVEVKEQDDITEHIDNKQDKKIRLASIKGINKNIRSLFDDEPVEILSTDLKQSNVPVPAVQTATARPDFKIDLNDRIAFTKHLFGGSQNDLNETIQNLNSCINLTEAKQYLSDMYYEKNWSKADDYAQRLWSLVENKFL